MSFYHFKQPLAFLRIFNGTKQPGTTFTDKEISFSMDNQSVIEKGTVSESSEVSVYGIAVDAWYAGVYPTSEDRALVKDVEFNFVRNILDRKYAEFIR